MPSSCHSCCGSGQTHAFQLPKVLHHIAGKPLLEHVIDTAFYWPRTTAYRNFWTSRRKNPKCMQHNNVQWILQEQLGTGHAVLQALPAILKDNVLILYGDVPLISIATLKN